MLCLFVNILYFHVPNLGKKNYNWRNEQKVSKNSQTFCFVKQKRKFVFDYLNYVDPDDVFIILKE